MSEYHNLMYDPHFNVLSGSDPLLSRGDEPDGSEEGKSDMDIPYRYRIVTVKSNYAYMSLSPIYRSREGSYRIHLLSSDFTLKTTQNDMAPDPSTHPRRAIIQTNLLHHYGITRGIMGMRNSSPIIPGRPEDYYLNVSDFGPESDQTTRLADQRSAASSRESSLFDITRYIDRLLIAFVMEKANYELLTGYPLAPGTTATAEMASLYLKRSFTTYGKTKCAGPSTACSFSFSFYRRPTDGVPQLGLFYRSTPKSFRSMEELIALVPRESQVKLILKPTIALTHNYAGMNEAACRLYHHEGVPIFSIQVIYQVCTINVDLPATP